MTAILAALSGKKTYIIVGLYVLCIAVEKGAGIDIPGFDPGAGWLDQLLVMLGIGGLRAGVAKA